MFGWFAIAVSPEHERSIQYCFAEARAKGARADTETP
jgi:hypothetical protein